MRWLINVLAACLVSQAQGLTIHEATIEELQAALSAGQINAVQLAAKHLHRVAQFDRRGTRLNSIPVINLKIFEEAQASDEHRASTGKIRSNLEGIPYTLKDSYMATGMTVASGSPAFGNLTSKADAFTTSQIRAGGAVLFGKTNMPPMANGGMQRGYYGRAGSPYNKDYLTAAYGSGSSNGAGTSTAASMAVFGMGEETVSSGRSPASNNGLVAYTPSRGVLSIRGNWPLFPIADVPVPYTRTVKDMFSLLDVIVAEDKDTTCYLWRGQPFVPLPPVSAIKPGTYHKLANAESLKGKKIGVPKMYIGGNDPAAQPLWTNPTVIELWKEARKTLEALGATVKEVDFPLVTNYESKATGPIPWETDYPLAGGAGNASLRAPGPLAAYSWDDYLKMVGDPSIPSFASVDPTQVSPQWPNTLPDRYGNRFGNRTANYAGSINTIKTRNGTSIYAIPGLKATFKAVEAQRKVDLEDWMDAKKLDLIVFPAAGDVGRQDAETNNASAIHAWRNGVYFSNGNYAIRQFGVPTVSVTMGTMSDTKMPMSLTFASKAYDDNALLSYGYAFEKAHDKRVAPPLTPPLCTDTIKGCRRRGPVGAVAPQLKVTAERDGIFLLKISGNVANLGAEEVQSMEIFVDGASVGPVAVKDGAFSIVAAATPWDDDLGDIPHRFANSPDQSKAMVVAVVTSTNGRSDGKMLFV